MELVKGFSFTDTKWNENDQDSEERQNIIMDALREARETSPRPQQRESLPTTLGR
jgi:hypothetical protein